MAPIIPHFKGLVMRNLEYEIIICQQIHTKVTITIYNVNVVQVFFESDVKAHSLADLFCALILRFHFPRIISFLPAHSRCQKTSQSKKMKTRFL